jgi:hypothetical protein
MPGSNAEYSAEHREEFPELESVPLARCIGCGSVMDLADIVRHFQGSHKDQSVYAHVYWRIPTKFAEWWR